MARPRKQPQTEPPGFRQTVRARFIEFGVRHNCHALRLLCTKVRNGEMSLQAWAESFHVAETWVEQWAQDALDSWKLYTEAPAPAENLPWWIMAPRDPLPAGMRPYEPGRLVCPPPEVQASKLDMEYPLPRACETDCPQTAETDCERHGADPWFNNACPDCGRAETAKRRKRRDRLAAETAKLNSKLEYVAIYLLDGETVDKLARNHYVSTPAMHGWLSEAMGVLGLKMRPRGHRSVLQ